MSKRLYRSKGKGKRKRAPAPDPEFAGIPAELPHTEEVAPPQAPLAPPAPLARALRDTPAIAAADGKRTNLPRSVRDRAPRIEGQVLPEDRPHLDGSRAPRIEGFEGQAPSEDRESIDGIGNGSEKCLPPLVDGSKGTFGPRRAAEESSGPTLIFFVLIPRTTCEVSPEGGSTCRGREGGKIRAAGRSFESTSLSLALLIFRTTCEVSPEGGSTCRRCKRREVWPAAISYVIQR